MFNKYSFNKKKKKERKKKEYLEIIEFGFLIIWRIIHIEKGVIGRGGKHPP